MLKLEQDTHVVLQYSLQRIATALEDIAKELKKQNKPDDTALEKEISK